MWLDAPKAVRFIKVHHLVTDKKPWGKVYMWEIQAYDQFGRWGPPPAPAPHPRTFRQLLGVNGIWGWGLKNQSAGVLYNEIASSARNYQNLGWDVRAPQHDPRYDSMPGTDAMWWLDWDAVYRAWRATNLRVVVTIQFTADDFPAAAWLPNPRAAAYQLGYHFARHFGPTAGNGLVSAVEFGNEPWMFNASFYSTVREWRWGGRGGGVKRASALRADQPPCLSRTRSC